MKERTFIMIKPEHVSRAEEIMQELSRHGKVVHQATIPAVSRSLIEEHYSPHRQKPFYSYLVDAFVNQPVVVAVYEGEDIVQKIMEACGPTDPAKAPPDTIRGKYSADSLEQAMAEQRPVRNVIHRSDSPAEAEREIGVWQAYFR